MAMAIRVWRNVPRGLRYSCRGKEVGVRISRGHRPLDITVGVEKVRLKVVETFLLAPPYEQSNQECYNGDATNHPANDRTYVDTGRAVVVIGADDRNSGLDDVGGSHQISIGISCCPRCYIRR